MINSIICGNNVDVLKTFPDNYVDLVVTSPPYDNFRKYKGYTFDFESTAKELHRVLKPGGVIVWVVGDASINGSETGTSFRQVLYFKDIGFNIHDTMIYQKNGISYPDSTRYYQNFEYMFILSKGQPKCISLIADRENKWLFSWGRATTRGKDGVLSQRKSYHKGNKYGVRFNIWKINGGHGFSSKDKIAYKHPAIFPEKLAEDHILSWSKDGDLILDPFVGSGTTCKMAKINNRNYIGIDCSDVYCEIACKRIGLDFYYKDGIKTSKSTGVFF